MNRIKTNIKTKRNDNANKHTNNTQWQMGKRTWKLSNVFETYFQTRESPAPLNIPTPTPAPDRGGPIPCLSGPVISLYVPNIEFQKVA